MLSTYRHLYMLLTKVSYYIIINEVHDQGIYDELYSFVQVIQSGKNK